MAKNKPIGDNARKGAVKNRSQVLNTKTNLFVKRDSDTGRFLDVKTTGGKFKAINHQPKKIDYFTPLIVLTIILRVLIIKLPYIWQ